MEGATSEAERARSARNGGNELNKKGETGEAGRNFFCAPPFVMAEGHLLHHKGCLKCRSDSPHDLAGGLRP